MAVIVGDGGPETIVDQALLHGYDSKTAGGLKRLIPVHRRLVNNGSGGSISAMYAASGEACVLMSMSRSSTGTIHAKRVTGDWLALRPAYPSAGTRYVL